MKTYELLDKSGHIFAFEVNSAGLGRRGVCRVVGTIPGAQITRRPKFLSWFRDEVFCEFSIDGKTFIVLEPFGDNSRYWIGPEPPEPTSQIVEIRGAFDRATVSSIGRVFGFLLGALGASVGVWMLADGTGRDTIGAVSAILFGLYFIHFALTGHTRIFSYWKRR